MKRNDNELFFLFIISTGLTFSAIIIYILTEITPLIAVILVSALTSILCLIGFNLTNQKHENPLSVRIASFFNYIHMAFVSKHIIYHFYRVKL